MRRLPFALALLASLIVLFTPGPDVPDVSANDKAVHALMFAVLAATGCLARVPAVALGLGLAAYAGVSEVLQATLPIHRDGSWQDAAADCVGVLLGLAAGRVVASLRSRS